VVSLGDSKRAQLIPPRCYRPRRLLKNQKVLLRQIMQRFDVNQPHSRHFFLGL